MSLLKSLVTPGLRKVPDGPVKDVLRSLFETLQSQHQQIRNNLNTLLIDEDYDPPILRKWNGSVNEALGAASIVGQGALATLDEGDINIDNIADGITYKKFTSTEDTKLGGVETGADVTSDHANDVIYRGNTPPAHKAGRVWYCLVNGSYDNYTLYKSTGSAWEVISDTTAQHQADVQLANLGEKSLTSLDDLSLANLDETADTKLGGIETLADVTGDHEAATIVGQGDLATTNETDADVLNMTNAPAEAGADVTGSILAVIASSMLPNWRLDVVDSDDRPAGIYPVASIADFSGLDWLDSGKAEINIAHASDNTIGYGFAAIPIDDKQKYTIVIRHKAPVASGSGLYLRMNQYNAALPAGKTHIGAAGGTGGANCVDLTNLVDLVSNGAFPGTSWEVDEYTYTPTSGTKYASFAMLNWTGAGLKAYHVDYVLMFLIPKTAEEIDTPGSRKWAGETGADITGGHTAADISGQGDLATLNTVDTPQIDDNAVTVLADVHASSSIELSSVGEEDDLLEIEFTTSGERVFISVSVSIKSGVGLISIIDLRLYRDAVEILNVDNILVETNVNTIISFQFSETPSADTYTYKLTGQWTSGSWNAYVTERNMYMHELKK